MQKTFVLLLFTLIISITYGQLLPCGQHIYFQEQLKDSSFRSNYALEKEIQKKVLHEMLLNPSLKRGVVYKIPVVFHILHSNGDENISKEQIVNQMAILNKDFRLLNADAKNVHPDFKNITADAEIEFVLATKAPNGACFSGITRTYISKATTDGHEQVDLIKSSNDIYKGEWTGNKYLNIFVSTGLNGPAGYAYKPYGNGNSMESGIYILHRYIGSIGSGSAFTSRALTHEVGHWLNLDHTWGPNNNPGDTTSCGTDDGISDTPNCIGDKSICNLDDKYCGPRANVENFMEYSYCSKMFTQGQIERMRAALLSPVGGRNKIISASNLEVVGANNISICKVDFTSTNAKTCEGGQVSFTDISYNAPVSWLWSFPGGTPSSSILQNPVVTYSNKGNYTVTLTVSDGKNSKTETKTNFVSVLSDLRVLPFVETFASYTSLSNASFWNSSNLGNNQSFQVFTGAGYSDNTCLKLANFVENSVSTDELTSNAIDLSKVTSQGLITLTFRYAYRKKNSANSEVLRVSMSGDCGSNWNIRKTLSGANLSSLVSTTDWTPTSISDWTTVHVTNINSSYWNANTRIRFSFDGSGGNNFYLDDINLYPSSPTNSLFLGVEELKSTDEIRIFPNPTDKELSLEFQLNSPQNIDYEIFDVQGKKIINNSIQAASGNNLLIIPTKDLLDGSYFIKLHFGGEAVVKYFQVGRE
jgi:PKD repeat protein